MARVRVIDIHTHLYDPAFGDLLLWGLDDLLVYHYLVAEAFRWSDLPYDRFWALDKPRQAEFVWERLFAQRSPVSEACRGVVTTLNRLGLDPRRRDLPALRRWFAQWKPRDYVARCMELAGVDRIYMTNSPFDPVEKAVWDAKMERDERFRAGLRLDPLLLDWKATSGLLRAWGYETSPALTARTLREVERFLEDWRRRMDPGYLMVSLPPDFGYPARTPGAILLARTILPFCARHGLPFAVMPGVRRAVNPGLRMAGDGMAWTRMESLEALCRQHPDNKFLATVLARENQHALCVMARKFRNLHVFGCWWFTNVPSIIEEMTRMRLELIGLSVTLQHSDARVMDQIIYKWAHSREVIGRVLAEKYADLARAGWLATQAEIDRDVQSLFGGAFETFCGGGSTR